MVDFGLSFGSTIPPFRVSAYHNVASQVVTHELFVIIHLRPLTAAGRELWLENCAAAHFLFGESKN
jgi:hypothetical protein